jgi:hypothetical protein
MRIGKFVLLSLATLGCNMAQENSAPQQIQPENPRLEYFTQPQFRPLRPFVMQNGLAPQEAPLAKPKLDFKLPLLGSLRRLAPQTMRPNLKVIPDGQNLLAENPSTCSIPLLQAEIPKDRRFTIRQFHPSPDQLGRMATVKAPAPACAKKSEAR